MILYGRILPKKDRDTIEVAYIIVNDPDNERIPKSFHKYIANMITMFWKLQLEQNYPTWKWEIFIDDDEEITIGYSILSKWRLLKINQLIKSGK